VGRSSRGPRLRKGPAAPAALLLALLAVALLLRLRTHLAGARLPGLIAQEPVPWRELSDEELSDEELSS